MVNSASVACVVIRTQSKDTRVRDILVRKAMRGRGYGKEVMVHTCKELFELDGIHALQLNVICRGKERVALSKIINHCVSGIDGVVGGPVCCKETWRICASECARVRKIQENVGVPSAQARTHPHGSRLAAIESTEP